MGDVGKSGRTCEESTVIPLEVIFGGREPERLRLSPDGKTLAFVATDGAERRLFIGPALAPSEARPVSGRIAGNVIDYRWAPNGRHIVLTHDCDGGEMFNAVLLDVATGSAQPLTGTSAVRTEIVAVGAGDAHADEVVLKVISAVSPHGDLTWVDFDTGRSRSTFVNPGYTRVHLDHALRVRVVARMHESGAHEFSLIGDAGEEQRLMWVETEDVVTTEVLGLSRTDDVVYALSSQGRDTAALVSFDVKSGEWAVLAEDPDADICEVVFDPVTGRPRAASSRYLRKRWIPLTEDADRRLKAIQSVADWDLSIESQSADGDTWVVRGTQDTAQPRYVIADFRPEKPLITHLLFDESTEFESLSFAPMRPFIAHAPDGLNLVGYISLPNPPPPHPTVMLVHGGPWSRDVWAFDPYHQWLCSLGYAAISVNFRGSTGFGKQFVNAAAHEWGGLMQDDLLAALAWAVHEGHADPEKTAIMGTSYGGYAALMELTRKEPVFSCAVSISGPTDLKHFLEALPPQWQSHIDFLASQIGDHRTKEGRALLRQRSPIRNVGSLRRPVLLAHGKNDPRVPESDVREFTRVLESMERPVRYLRFSTEGHLIKDRENHLSLCREIEKFFALHISGHSGMMSDARDGNFQFLE